mmetsp:Transcript_84833/g.236705  ORF Transcript_84833/g.236705 Transcript_84833/m.236705 type:complete len:200 (+) Transcript_84833:1108-1707(+)
MSLLRGLRIAFHTERREPLLVRHCQDDPAAAERVDDELDGRPDLGDPIHDSHHRVDVHLIGVDLIVLGQHVGDVALRDDICCGATWLRRNLEAHQVRIAHCGAFSLAPAVSLNGAHVEDDLVPQECRPARAGNLAKDPRLADPLASADGVALVEDRDRPAWAACQHERRAMPEPVRVFSKGHVPELPDFGPIRQRRDDA